jgi:hypothetical protein
MNRSSISETELLKHALIGYQRRRDEIEAARLQLAARINGLKEPVSDAPRPRRRLSPEGRARIIAATKRRWAKARRMKRATGRGRA